MSMRLAPAKPRKSGDTCDRLHVSVGRETASRTGKILSVKIIAPDANCTRLPSPEYVQLARVSGITAGRPDS